MSEKKPLVLSRERLLEWSYPEGTEFEGDVYGLPLSMLFLRSRGEDGTVRVMRFEGEEGRRVLPMTSRPTTGTWWKGDRK